MECGRAFCTAEGTLLLCLIGKTIDACRYLCSYGCWTRAVTLARTATDLTEEERAEVLRKWAEHLLNSDVQDKVLSLSQVDHS